MDRKPPKSLSMLRKWLGNAVPGYGVPYEVLERTLANVIVCQCLPHGPVRGGAAMTIRGGIGGTRASQDLDTIRSTSHEEYVVELSKNLAQGWSGFTGEVIERKAHNPPGVPDGYVMRPLDIKLIYNAKTWVTVKLEVGYGEGLSDLSELNGKHTLNASIIELFKELGLPEPDNIPVLPLARQVAEKLHACTTPDNDRARDLVDLQLLDVWYTLNLAAIHAVVTRLFSARQLHEWPPTVQSYEDWDILYEASVRGIDVLPDLRQAIDWANMFVESIDNAECT